MRFACGRCAECDGGDYAKCLAPRGQDESEGTMSGVKCNECGSVHTNSHAAGCWVEHFERGKQEGERLGLERAAAWVDEQWRNFKSLSANGYAIRALASTPSADWVVVERSKLEAIRRLATYGGPELDGIRDALDAILKK